MESLRELRALVEPKAKLETRAKLEAKVVPLARSSRPQPVLEALVDRLLQESQSLSISSKSSSRSRRVTRMVPCRSCSCRLSSASIRLISYSATRQLVRFSTPSLVRLNFPRSLIPSLVSATQKCHSSSQRC